MNREAYPRRTGPQPLALHLAVKVLALMSSMAALPLLRNGSLSWNPNLQPLATELMERIAQTTPDAFTEVLRAEAQARYPRGDAYYLLAVPGADDVLVDAADPERSNWLRYLNHA